jgi:TPR repeat protein
MEGSGDESFAGDDNFQRGKRSPNARLDNPMSAKRGKSIGRLFTELESDEEIPVEDTGNLQTMIIGNDIIEDVMFDVQENNNAGDLIGRANNDDEGAQDEIVKRFYLEVEDFNPEMFDEKFWSSVLRKANESDLYAHFVIRRCSVERISQEFWTKLWERFEEDNSFAQYNIAIAYRFGIGIPPNLPGAAKLSNALNCLSMASHCGNPAALKLLKEAADMDFPHALYMLGERYRLGEDVPMNPVVALEWYQRAADQDHLPSKHQLEQLSSFK